MEDRQIRENDAPRQLMKYKRGSNNGTAAEFRVMEYPDALCVQLEDQEGGGEMWFDGWRSFEDFVRQMARIVIRKGSF